MPPLPLVRCPDFATGVCHTPGCDGLLAFAISLEELAPNGLPYFAGYCPRDNTYFDHANVAENSPIEPTKSSTDDIQAAAQKILAMPTDEKGRPLVAVADVTPEGARAMGLDEIKRIISKRLTANKAKGTKGLSAQDIVDIFSLVVPVTLNQVYNWESGDRNKHSVPCDEEGNPYTRELREKGDMEALAKIIRHYAKVSQTKADVMNLKHNVSYNPNIAEHNQQEIL